MSPKQKKAWIPKSSSCFTDKGLAEEVVRGEESKHSDSKPVHMSKHSDFKPVPKSKHSDSKRVQNKSELTDSNLEQQNPKSSPIHLTASQKTRAGSQLRSAEHLLAQEITHAYSNLRRKQQLQLNSAAKSLRFTDFPEFYSKNLKLAAELTKEKNFPFGSPSFLSQQQRQEQEKAASCSTGKKVGEIDSQPPVRMPTSEPGGPCKGNPQSDEQQPNPNGLCQVSPDFVPQSSAPTDENLENLKGDSPNSYETDDFSTKHPEEAPRNPKKNSSAPKIRAPAASFPFSKAHQGVSSPEDAKIAASPRFEGENCEDIRKFDSDTAGTAEHMREAIGGGL